VTKVGYEVHLPAKKSKGKFQVELA